MSGTSDKLYRNRECYLPTYPDLSLIKDRDQSNILNKCCKNLSNFTLDKIIGSGSYGTVWTGHCLRKKTEKKRKRSRSKLTEELEEYEQIDIVIKIEISSKAEFEETFLEIEFNYYMSDVDLGPKIYDAFYIRDPKRSLYIAQFIIMESFDYNCKDALINNNYNITEKKEIISQMINLLKSSIFNHNMYCSDIKPGNYVVNGLINVKMIDFGSNFCFLNADVLFSDLDTTTNIKKIVFYLIILLQLYLFIEPWLFDQIDIKDLFKDLGHLKNFQDFIKYIIYHKKSHEVRQFLHYHPYFTENVFIQFINNF